MKKKGNQEQYQEQGRGQDRNKRKTGKVRKFLTTVLAVFGILFIILLLLPDDEEDTDGGPVRDVAAVESTADTEIKETGKKGAEEKTEGTEPKEAKEPNGTGKTVSVGTDAESATVMIYMNGSDLESQAGKATMDIAEMLDSGIGKNVNVIVQTMGTKKWQYYGISSQTAQTYCIEDGKLKLIRDGLGQLDSTSRDTLSEFIGFCKEGYPAERYLFLFWDHGGGPVYGFGHDEWQDDQQSLTIAEMAGAFQEHDDIRFDIIGMDCCIMASMETCYALAPYCRYALLSEDFESGLGWSYTGWMKEFEENPGMPTPLLGKYIVDGMIEDNENELGGDSACISLFNESTVKNLFTAWKAYAYRNEDALLNKNYSKKHLAKGRGFLGLWGSDGSDVTLEDYYISDMLALVESIDNKSDEAKSLTSALKACVAYYGHTEDKNELTGLAVSLPYGDAQFYGQLKEVYRDIGLDGEYVDWLGSLVTSSGHSNFFNFGSFEESWGGWGDYEDKFGCNISGGGSCEYGYDYESGDGYDGDEMSDDDWIYDYDEEIWYTYEDDVLYLYDEESNLIFYYDEDEDEVYYYDEDDDDWYLVE